MKWRDLARPNQQPLLPLSAQSKENETPEGCLIFRFILFTISESFVSVKPGSSAGAGSPPRRSPGRAANAAAAWLDSRSENDSFKAETGVSHATRRRFLKLAASAGAVPVVLGPLVRAGGGPPGEAAPLRLGDSVLMIEFDEQMRSRLAHVRGAKPLFVTDWSAGEWLELKGGLRIEAFALKSHARESIQGKHGRAQRLTLSGTAIAAGGALEKTMQVELAERYPGLAFCRLTYRNAGARPLALRTWHSADRRASGATGAGRGRAGVLVLLRQHAPRPSRLGAAGARRVCPGQLHGHGRQRLRRRHADGGRVAARRAGSRSATSSRARAFCHCRCGARRRAHSSASPAGSPARSRRARASHARDLHRPAHG